MYPRLRRSTRISGGIVALIASVGAQQSYPADATADATSSSSASASTASLEKPKSIAASANTFTRNRVLDDNQQPSSEQGEINVDTCFDGTCHDDPLYYSPYGLPCQAHASWVSEGQTCIDKWSEILFTSDVKELCKITADSTPSTITTCLFAFSYTEREVVDLIMHCPCTCNTSCKYGNMLRDNSWSSGPTTYPTAVSTALPTNGPTKAPITTNPTYTPTTPRPTPSPSRRPTERPSALPTMKPSTISPTLRPTLQQSTVPSSNPAASGNKSEYCFDTCKDDDDFVNSRGFDCRLYKALSLDCREFGILGYNEEMIFKLINACPCSCNIQCGTWTTPPTLSPITASPTFSPTVAPASGPSPTSTKVPTKKLTLSPTAIPTASPPNIILSSNPTTFPKYRPTQRTSNVASVDHPSIHVATHPSSNEEQEDHAQDESVNIRYEPPFPPSKMEQVTEEVSNNDGRGVAKLSPSVLVAAVVTVFVVGVLGSVVIVSLKRSKIRQQSSSSESDESHESTSSGSEYPSIGQRDSSMLVHPSISMQNSSIHEHPSISRVDNSMREPPSISMRNSSMQDHPSIGNSSMHEPPSIRLNMRSCSMRDPPSICMQNSSMHEYPSISMRNSSMRDHPSISPGNSSMREPPSIGLSMQNSSMSDHPSICMRNSSMREPPSIKQRNSSMHEPPSISMRIGSMRSSSMSEPSPIHHQRSSMSESRPSISRRNSSMRINDTEGVEDLRISFHDDVDDDDASYFRWQERQQPSKDREMNRSIECSVSVSLPGWCAEDMDNEIAYDKSVIHYRDDPAASAYQENLQGMEVSLEPDRGVKGAGSAEDEIHSVLSWLSDKANNIRKTVSFQGIENKVSFQAEGIPEGEEVGNSESSDNNSILSGVGQGASEMVNGANDMIMPKVSFHADDLSLTAKETHSKRHNMQQPSSILRSTRKSFDNNNIVSM